MSAESDAIPTEKTTTEKVRELVTGKIDSGFQVADKKTVSELNKLVRDELKLPVGWSSDVKRIIGEVMTEKGQSIAKLGINSNKMGNLKVELIKEAEELIQDHTIPPDQHANAPASEPASPRGTMPKGFGSEIVPRPPTETEQQEQKIQMPKQPMSDEQKRQQEKLIVKSFGFLEEIYVSLGLVKGTEEEQKAISEPKPLEKFHQDVEDFAHELNEFMVDNDVRLPQWLNMLAIAVSGFMIFGMPVVKFFVFKPDAKPEYDSSVDDIKVDV